MEVAALAGGVQSGPLEMAPTVASESTGLERSMPWMRRISCFTFSRELCISFCRARMLFFISMHFCSNEKGGALSVRCADWPASLCGVEDPRWLVCIP